VEIFLNIIDFIHKFATQVRKYLRTHIIKHVFYKIFCRPYERRDFRNYKSCVEIKHTDSRDTDAAQVWFVLPISRL